MQFLSCKHRVSTKSKIKGRQRLENIDLKSLRKVLVVIGPKQVATLETGLPDYFQAFCQLDLTNLPNTTKICQTIIFIVPPLKAHHNIICKRESRYSFAVKKRHYLCQSKM